MIELSINANPQKVDSNNPVTNQNNEVKKINEFSKSWFAQFCEWLKKCVKVFIYKVSLIPTILANNFQPKKYPWFQSIVKNKLTLGAIPLKNRGHLDLIVDHGVTDVLTLLENFERETQTFYSKPISSADWQSKGVGQKIIETPDFLPIAIEKINEGVEFLHKKIIEEKKHVYVHCKAGRGRSATIVIAFLLKYGSTLGINKSSIAEVVAYVKSKRSVINLNAKQMKAVEAYQDQFGGR